ncbi:MAG: deoxyribose-phosphate aldolase [Acidimicrobiia bacterium]
MTLAPSARQSILPDRITNATLASFVRAVPSVDEVGVQERVGSLGTRSIKRQSKAEALRLAIRMMDLTTLEGMDTPGKVAQMSAKAIHPDPTDGSIPSVAAVCVYPAMIPYARQALTGSSVKVAVVATYFPSGQADLGLRLSEVTAAVEAGADEIDMVISRGSFLCGDYFKVFDEIVKVREACGDAHLKVILETGELQTLDNVRRASVLAMAAGADFIKTSTGKVSPAATLPVTLVMLEAIRDFRTATGVQVGMKPVGGIRTAKDSIRYLVLVNETLGRDWLTPDWFRFGASSLLNDVLMQIRWLETGRYQNPDYFTND